MKHKIFVSKKLYYQIFEKGSGYIKTWIARNCLHKLKKKIKFGFKWPNLELTKTAITNEQNNPKYYFQLQLLLIIVKCSSTSNYRLSLSSMFIFSFWDSLQEIKYSKWIFWLSAKCIIHQIWCLFLYSYCPNDYSCLP